MITKRPASRGNQSALAVSAWPLRRKVALALAIPLLLAGAFGGLRVHGDLVAASNSSASAQQVTALRPAVSYLNAAEQAMVAAVATDKKGRAALEEALADLREAGRELSESKESAELTADQRYQVDVVLELSQVLRSDDASSLSPGTWVAQLRQLHSGVTELITSIVNEQINPEPRLELLAQTVAGRFSLAMQQALVATERTGETGSLELFSELGVEGAAIDRLATSLGASEKAVASLRTANAQRFRTVRTGGTDLGGVEAYADYDGLIRTLQDGIDTELEAAAADARAAAAVNAMITLAALVAAILLALLVSRLLLNPIRRVREGALAVAHEQLPEAVARIRAGEEPGEITPIDVTTEEEIGQLARAVDDMHRQAVVLASGEADLRSQVSQMFVTLSRRNTSLVNQQLGLIERLERDEEDPKRLESLFRLDHLAARMRRTADSLVILADAPTASAGVDGLTVSDALQAATSGVLDYKRVRIRSANPMRIDDGVAADVVHLLTELVDNALTYSPPTSTVSIGSTTTAEGVVIEIADAGLGIAAEQLDKINDALRSGGEVTPETARRMGLFVVSRLSQRHGLTTSLRPNDDGGATATVLLPAAVLPELVPSPTPQPTASPSRSDAAKVAEAGAPEKVRSTPAQDQPERPVGAKSVKAGRHPEQADRKPKRNGRKPAAVEANGEQPAAMDVEARIDRALGLPTRRPGATVTPGTGAPAPVTPESAAAALASLRPLANGADLSPAAEQSALQSLVQPVDEPVAKGSNGAPDSLPGAVPDDATEGEQAHVSDAGSEAAVPQEASTPESLVVPEPAPAPKATSTPQTSNGALDGDWTDPGDEGFDTPIFRSLRSAWLSTGDDTQPWRTSEIEEGWEKADQVAETKVEPEVSRSGLPVRRPGSRLVPGGVTTTQVAKTRDPEAIRARLAAHASGVSRGRAAAATASAPDPS
jgi:signal transduction histidine kinase